MRVRFLFLLVFLALSCGDCDDPQPGDDIDPSEVTFDLLQGGFWVHANSQNNLDILQFIRANDARNLYRGAGVNDGVSDVLAPLEPHLDKFGNSDAMIMEFSRSSGLSNLFGTKIEGGKIGHARYLKSEMGFDPVQYELEITEFSHRQSMVLDGKEYLWTDDCTYFLESNRAFPGATGAFARSGDAYISGFKTIFGPASATLSREGACPMAAAIDFGFEGLPQLHPYGERGTAGFEMAEGNLLRITQYDGDTTVRLAEVTTPHVEVYQVRPIDDQTFVLLMGHPQLGGPLFTGRLRAVLTAESAEVEDMPMPSLPANHVIEKYRLLPDGRAVAHAKIRVDSEPDIFVLLLEEDGAWTSLDLVGTTEEGQIIDVSPGFSIQPDLSGTVHALLGWPDIRTGHPRLGDFDVLQTLVSIKDGVATTHPLPALAGARGGLMDLDDEGNLVFLQEWYGGFQGGIFDMRATCNLFGRESFVISRLGPDGLTSVSSGGDGRPGGSCEPVFFSDPTIAGTAFLAIPHNSFTPGVGAVFSNGWSRVWTMPAVTNAPNRSWTLRLVDPPEGASVKIIETGEECDGSCEYSHQDGRYLGLELTTPEGWIVKTTQPCFYDWLDAGFCGVYLDPAPKYCAGGPSAFDPQVVCTGEDAKVEEPIFEFTYERTPVLAVSTVNALHEDLNFQIDGSFSSLLEVFSPDPLPDGTVAEGATVQNPAFVLSRWNREEFVWSWYSPEFEVVAHTLQGEDALAVLRATGGTQQIQNVSVPSGEFVRVVFGPDGEPTNARLLDTTGLADASFLALSNGSILVAGRANANSVLGNVESSMAIGGFTSSSSEPTLIWESTNLPQANTNWLETPSGGAFVIFGNTNAHTVLISSALALLAERALEAEAGGTRIAPNAIVLGRDSDTLYAGLAADQNVEIMGLSLPVAAPSIVTIAINTTGEPTFPVVFTRPASEMGEVGIRGLTSLNGKRLVVAGAGSLTDETFYIDGNEPFTIGRRAAGANNLNGFTSKALMPVGGQLLWITRAWSREFRIRPYRVSGSVVIRLDAAEFATLPDVIVNEQD